MKEALKLALEAFDSMIGRKPERVEQAIKEALETTGESGKVLIAGNFLLNLLISASLNKLWSMINT